jgi:hypothetical protein
MKRRITSATCTRYTHPEKSTSSKSPSRFTTVEQGKLEKTKLWKKNADIVLVTNRPTIEQCVLRGKEAHREARVPTYVHCVVCEARKRGAMMEAGDNPDPPKSGEVHNIPRGVSGGDSSPSHAREQQQQRQRGEGTKGSSTSFLDRIRPRSSQGRSTRAQAARAGSPHTTTTHTRHDSKKEHHVEGADVDGSVEDLEAALATARAVISHLDEQVRTLSKRVDDSEADTESLQKMLANLGASLKEERLERLMRNNNAHEEDGDSNLTSGMTTAATTAAEDVSVGDDRGDSNGVGGTDVGAGTNGGGGGSRAAGAGRKDGGSSGSEGWEDLPSLVRDGISGGWLVEPGEVVEGHVLGRGCSGVTAAGKWRGQLVAVGGVGGVGWGRLSSLSQQSPHTTPKRDVMKPFFLFVSQTSLLAGEEGERRGKVPRGFLRARSGGAVAAAAPARAALLRRVPAAPGAVLDPHAPLRGRHPQGVAARPRRGPRRRPAAVAAPHGGVGGGARDAVPGGGDAHGDAPRPQAQQRVPHRRGAARARAHRGLRPRQVAPALGPGAHGRTRSACV